MDQPAAVPASIHGPNGTYDPQSCRMSMRFPVRIPAAPAS